MVHATATASKTATGATASPEELARFAAMAEAWWDPRGKFRPLHRLNPPRTDYIRVLACRHFGRDPAADRPFAGLRLLDVGCGGGLLAEPMCRLGAAVTGIDALERNIGIASLHAEENGLGIDYRMMVPEELAHDEERFDIVLSMEIVEHVADLDAFLDACSRLTRPGGVLVLSTLNRTLKSLALAKVGAEYILRWLPAGTHDWRKFVKPSELVDGLRRHGLEATDLIGMSYNPLVDEWFTSRDLAVNYMAFATRPE